MRVAVLTDGQTIEFKERSKPALGKNEVLVKTQEIGICGSDLHFYEHGRIGDNVVENPLVLGHESAGEIVETGDAVANLHPRDRVALEPGVPCRQCQFCKRGDYQLCQHETFMAAPPDDGAFAEYIAWPADFAHKLPEHVTTLGGTLCEPLSVGIHACRRGNVTVGDTVVITGAGPIGQLTLQAAEAAGATNIIVSDVVEEKLTLAKTRGADLVIDVSTDDLATVVTDYTHGNGADVVIEASGAKPAAETIIDLGAPGATAVAIGFPDESNISIDLHKLIRNEIDFRGSYRYSNTYDVALDLIANNIVDVVDIVDFRYPFEELVEAFEKALEPGSVKGSITMDG